MSVSNLTLWVKSEPFMFGALPVAPHQRLSLHNIKKIVSYAKTKGKHGYPRLTFAVWRHIACNKLQIPDDLAWMYFVTYDLVCDTDPQQRAEWDQRLATCKNTATLDHVKSAASVPTLQFILFLFMQHLHKISLKSSLNGSGGSEEWPMRTRSPELDSSRASGYNKNLDEQGHLSYILNHFNEILELLVEPESYNSGHGNDLCLTTAAIEALGFIIVGSLDKNIHTIKPLHEIAMLPQIQQKSGYSKLSCSYNFRSLQSWVRSKIILNPFGVSKCISEGRRLTWPLAGADRDLHRHDGKRGRIVSNGQMVSRTNVKGNKLIIMSQVCKQTVTRGPSNTLVHSSVKIHRCHYSFIYLLSTLRSVSIEKCRHTTVVLGSVETTVQLLGCEQVTVVCVTRRLQISGSSLCTLHLLTPTRPLILGSNSEITLAPYHTHYPHLEEHMNKAGLRPHPNYWDQPLPVGPDHHSTMPVWQLMAAEDFCKFTIPFEMSGPTHEIPGGLPELYRQACVTREKLVQQWQRNVKAAGLDGQQRKQFQSIVEERFQEWLDETGHRRALDGLVIPLPVNNRK